MVCTGVMIEIFLLQVERMAAENISAQHDGGLSTLGANPSLSLDMNPRRSLRADSHCNLNSPSFITKGRSVIELLNKLYNGVFYINRNKIIEARLFRISLITRIRSQEACKEHIMSKELDEQGSLGVDEQDFLEACAEPSVSSGCCACWSIRSQETCKDAGVQKFSKLARTCNDKHPLTVSWFVYRAMLKGKYHANFMGLITFKSVVALMVGFGPPLYRTLHYSGAFFCDSPLQAFIAMNSVLFGCVGTYILLTLVFETLFRFDQLQKIMLVVLFLSATNSTKKLLMSLYRLQLYDIGIGQKEGKILSLPKLLQDEQTEDAKELCDMQEHFRQEGIFDDAEKMMSMMSMTSDNDVEDVQNDTLNVKEFFLLRKILYTLVAVERLKQQATMSGAAFTMLVVLSTLVHVVLEHGLSVEAVYCFGLCCACGFLIALMLNQAVTMNNIMSDASLAVLATWMDHLLQAQWTWYENHKMTRLYDQNRIAADSYFNSLQCQYQHVINYIKNTEKPQTYFGVAMTSQLRNGILASMLSSASVFIVSTVKTSRFGSEVHELANITKI